MFWSLNKGFWSRKKCWRPCRTNVQNSTNWVLIYSEIHNLKYIFSNHANMSTCEQTHTLQSACSGLKFRVLSYTNSWQNLGFTSTNSWPYTHLLYSCKFFSGDSYSELMQILYFSLMFPRMRILARDKCSSLTRILY